MKHRRSTRRRSILLLVAVLAPVSAGLAALVPDTANASLPPALTPTADTTTDSQTPSTNYGTARTIYASPTSWKAFVRYDTSQIDDGATITSAQLRVYASSSSTSRWEVHPASPSWSEASTTYNAMPPWNSTVLGRSTSGASAGWNTIDLPVSAISTTSDTNLGVVGTASGKIGFESREATHPAELVLTYGSPGPAPTPTGTSSPTGTTTPTGNGSTPPAVDAGWTRIVDDRFDSGGIPSHWSVYAGKYGSGANNCAAPSQDLVEGGSLVLLMSYRTTGGCGAGWYTGGMQIAKSLGAVDQTMTVRMRVVSSDPVNVRSHRNVPMRWVDDPAYTWDQGQANYCEGSQATGCTTFLHKDSSSQVLHEHTFDVSRWHVFKVVHQNNRVRIYVDGALSWDYQGTATTVPDAVRRVVLQQECRSSCPATSYAGQTERIEVDYVTIDNES